MPGPKRHILMLLENSGMPEDTRVRNEAVGLVSHGFDVSVICPMSENRRVHEVFEGVHFYRYPAPFEFDGFLGYVWEFGYSLVMAFVYALFVWLQRGFDAIHVHSPPDMNCLVAIFFKLVASKKFVLDTHDLSPELYDAQKQGRGNSSVHRTLVRFERLAVRWADRLIATNETQKLTQMTRGGATPECCHVVRNGPADSFLDLAQPTNQLPSHGRCVIGYVGIVGIQDGVDAMIHSLHHLKNKLGRPGFLGVIVGDGPALPELRQLVADLDLQSHIHFTGMIPYVEVPAHIAAFDICVTPDPSNPYNDSCTTIKTMEYMVQSRPTVSFETPENRVTAKSSALYAADNSITQLADCMVRLMDSPELRDEMGERGRHRVLDELAWEHQEQELVRLYRMLLEGVQYKPTAKLPLQESLAPAEALK